MSDSIKNSYSNIRNEYKDPVRAIIEQMAETMVDSSRTLVGCHEIVDLNLNDKEKEEKLEKIHRELKLTLDNFRDRFAIVLGDIKYLAKDVAQQDKVKKMSTDLKHSSKNPDERRNIGKDALEVIEVIDPSLIKGPKPVQSRMTPVLKNINYDSPVVRTTTRSKERNQSTAVSNNYSEPIDQPAFTDRYERGKPHRKYESENKPKKTMIQIEITSADRVKVISRGASEDNRVQQRYRPRDEDSIKGSIHNGVYRPINNYENGFEGPLSARNNSRYPRFDPPSRRYIPPHPQTDRKYSNNPRSNTPSQYPLTARKIEPSPQPSVNQRHYTPLRADNPYNQPYQRSSSRASNAGSRRGSYRVIQPGEHSRIQPMSARQHYGYTPNQHEERHMPATHYRDYRAPNQFGEQT